MNTQAKIDEDRAERVEKLQGMGCKRKRVEDVRFTQGKGSYVDDLKLPGMLFGDFVRSPHAHARIISIDTSRAKALPGVIAVLTAADLKPLGLHYMPTLAGDVQARYWQKKKFFSKIRKLPSSLPKIAILLLMPPKLVDAGLRGAALYRRSVEIHAARRSNPARRHQGQDDRRARTAQTPEPYFRMGHRRQGSDRRGICQC